MAQVPGSDLRQRTGIERPISAPAPLVPLTTLPLAAGRPHCRRHLAVGGGRGLPGLSPRGWKRMDLQLLYLYE